jgi:hypothetical protein
MGTKYWKRNIRKEEAEYSGEIRGKRAQEGGGRGMKRGYIAEYTKGEPL